MHDSMLEVTTSYRALAKHEYSTEAKMPQLHVGAKAAAEKHHAVSDGPLQQEFQPEMTSAT